MTVGTVYLVGAGPGDPELLTLRAVRLIAAADTIVHDRLVHPGALAHAAPHTRLVYVGKEGGGEQVAQDDIDRLLIAQARLGRTVVRLKGGDPFVFGRGGEEALALEAAGVPYAIVPGVSSGLAAPAAAGIPVTHRGVAASVTFATATRADGPLADSEWRHLAGAPTLVLFMAGARLAEVATRLIAAGKPAATPAAVIARATLPDQQVVVAPLADLAVTVTTVAGPALVVVGPTVALHHQLAGLVAFARADARATDNPLAADLRRIGDA